MVLEGFEELVVGDFTVGGLMVDDGKRWAEGWMCDGQDDGRADACLLYIRVGLPSIDSSFG